jgi:rhamnosyl/mannosyltransferase
VQRALYRRAECVIVSSPPLADASPVVAHARRVAVIPFGIDVERFRSANVSTTAIRAVREAAEGPRVLFVGRLVYYKGVDVLLEAMASLAARAQKPGTLLVIGEGPLEPELRARATALGISNQVRLLGRVPDADLPAYYRAADVFVLPSVARTEAFGVVQVEAMASGVPVVSTNLPTGVPWVNQDGITGLVVPPGDSRALADALGRLLDDPALRARLGEAAAARAALRFSRDRMVADFRAVIEAAVAAPEPIDARVPRVEPL